MPASPRLTIGDFHFGAEVYSSDGTHVGNLRRVILDEESLDVHAIVAQETRRFSGHYFGGRGLLEDDIAIELTAVARAEHSRIELNVPTDEVRRATPYLRYHTVAVTRGDLASIALSAFGGMYVPRLDEEHDKDLNEVEINPGEPIMRENGDELGKVHDVLMDGNELVGVVMRPGHFREEVILQIRFLARSKDGVLFVRISEDDLARLAPFQPDDSAFASVPHAAT